MKIKYHGSKFWLIFWLILIFPLGLALLFTNCTFVTKEYTKSFKYEGSRFWLCFWAVVMLPIAIVLVLLNGFSVEKTDLWVDA